MDSEQVKLDSADYEVVPLNGDSSWEKGFQINFNRDITGQHVITYKTQVNQVLIQVETMNTLIMQPLKRTQQKHPTRIQNGLIKSSMQTDIKMVCSITKQVKLNGN